MKQVIKIEGGKSLNGEVYISGSKNATVALIPAAVLANEPVTILGVPEISDVASLSEILRILHADIEEKDDVLVIYLPEVHESIAGIIAGRIREKYYKPVFVLTKGEEGVKGSGRSTEEYSMYINSEA